jgi:hypothetical protein
MHKAPLAPDAKELHQFADFFSDSYFETKEKHPTAAYIRRQRQHRVKAVDECEARLLYVGPDVHAVQEFHRFVNVDGFAPRPSSPGILQFGVVRSAATVRWTWQGQTHSIFERRTDRSLPALESVWRATFGDTRPSGIEFLRGHIIGEFWDQPVVQYQPSVFAPTSEGWSTIVDGYHCSPSYDGMRSVIATDWFFALSMVFRIFGPSKAVIQYRTKMLRTIPIQRATLELGMNESTL